MTRFAESYAVWLADYYLLATVLLTLALVSAALLKQPAHRLMVTKSTLIALVLLAILCALPGWSIVHLLAAKQPSVSAEPVRPTPVDAWSAAKQPDSRPNNFRNQLQQPAVIPQASDEALARPIAPKAGWTAMLATAHLLGTACIVVWLALGWIASLRLRRTAQTAPANACSILDELALHNGQTATRPRLFAHDKIDVAVALGVLQPTILLPKEWTTHQSPDRLRAVLAHESTHILNHDLQWVALARILFIALWANPLFWLAKRRLRLDQEALADAAAAEITSRQQYAEQLVAWARDARSRSALHLSSAVGLWEGPSQLRQRIAILLDEHVTVLRECSRRWRICTAVLLLAGAAALSLITLQPTTRADEKTPNPKPAPAMLTSASETAPQHSSSERPRPNTISGRVVDDKGQPLTDTYRFPRALESSEKNVVVADADIGPAEVVPESASAAAARLRQLIAARPNRFCYFEHIEQASPHILDALDLKSTTLAGPYFVGQAGTVFIPLDKVSNWDQANQISDASLRERLNQPSAARTLSLAGAQQAATHFKNADPNPSHWPGAFFAMKAKQAKLSVIQVSRFVGSSVQILVRPRRRGWETDQPYVADMRVPDGVIGRVVDENDKPITTAEVSLFRVNQQDGTRKLLGKTSAGSSGWFRFDDVIDIEREFPDGKLPPSYQAGYEKLEGVVRAPGRATATWLMVPQVVAQRGEYHKAQLSPTVSTQENNKPNDANGTPATPDAPTRAASRRQPNTIIGHITDEKGQPIPSAEVFLFRINRVDRSRKLQSKTTTDAEGKYRFENVIDIAKEIPGGKLYPLNPLEEEFVQVFVRAPGRTSEMRMDLRQRIAQGIVFDLNLSPAARLTGRITGPDGKPVGGALVSVGGSGYTTWEGAASARTNSDGTYVIDDVPSYGIEEYRKKATDENRRMEAFRATKGGDTYALFVAPPMVTVEHPDFATKTAIYNKIPGEQDVQLESAATIEGRVLLGDANKPAVGVLVKLNTATPQEASSNEDRFIPNFFAAEARTDAAGKYRFASLPAGRYELSAEKPNWVNLSIEAFAAAGGKTSTAPNLMLTSGGIISIRLINDKTGEPIPIKPDTRADISAHLFPLATKGISHPSWTPQAAANPAGRFELHAPAGKRAVFVGLVYEGEQTKWINKQTRTLEPKVVDVVEDKTVEVDIPVIEMPKDPADVAKAALHTISPVKVPDEQPKKKSSSEDAATEPTPPKPAVKKARANEDGEASTAPITISGRAINKNAQPVAGAKVYLASLAPAYKRIAETVSEKDGKYTFKNIPLPIQRADTSRGTDIGAFEVFATAEGYGLTWRKYKRYYPNQTHFDAGKLEREPDWPVAYGTGDPIELDLHFGPATKIRGRVVDNAGKPIVNTLLDIRYADNEWNRENYRIVKDQGYLESLNERDIVPRNLKTCTTDQAGNFEFTGLPVDHRFQIWVHPPGFPTRTIWAVTNDTVDTTNKQAGNIYKGDINLVFNTPRKVPIEVIFGDTRKPAPKVLVSTGGAQGGSGGSTNDAGQVTATLPDGDFDVSIEPRIGTPYLNSKAKLTVSEASVKKPAQVVLEPAAVAKISVVDADTGKPLAGVDLWRLQPNADAPNGYRNDYGYNAWEVETNISHYDKHRTDKDGKMEVFFTPGKHRIGVGLHAYPEGYQAVDPNGKLIELEAGKPQSIQFQMRKKAQP